MVDELGLDDLASGGEDEGYVPCLDEALAQPPDDTDNVAVFGEDEGYTPDGTAAASDPGDGDDTMAVYGHSAGFVAKPCVPVFECDACGGEHPQSERDANITTGTSWSGGYHQEGHVDTPGGTMLDSTDNGTVFTRLSAAGYDGTLSCSIVPAMPPVPALAPPPSLRSEDQSRTYASFVRGGFTPTWPTLRFRGTIGLDVAWSGTLQTEGRALLPPTSWSLIAVFYDTADLQAVLGGTGAGALDLPGYTSVTVASGSLTSYAAPIDIDSAITIPNGNYVAFYIRADASLTPVVYNEAGIPSASIGTLDRFPAVPPKSLTFPGGLKVTIPTYTIQFCLCEVTP